MPTSGAATMPTSGAAEGLRKYYSESVFIICACAFLGWIFCIIGVSRREMYTIQSQSLPPSDFYRDGITVFFNISSSMGVTAVLGDERDVWNHLETLGKCPEPEYTYSGGGGGGEAHGRRRLRHESNGHTSVETVHPDGPWFTPSGQEVNTSHAASLSMLEGLDLSMCNKFEGSNGGISFKNGCGEDLGSYRLSKSSERCEHFDEMVTAALRSYCGVPAVMVATVAFLLALYEILVLKTGGSIQSLGDANNAEGTVVVCGPGAADWDVNNAEGPVVVCGPGAYWGPCPNPSSGLAVWRPKNLRRPLAIAAGAAVVLQIASAIITSPSFTKLPPEHVFGPGDALIGLQDLLAGDLDDHIKKSSVYFIWASVFTLAAVVINWRTPWRRATAKWKGPGVGPITVISVKAAL